MSPRLSPTLQLIAPPVAGLPWPGWVYGLASGRVRQDLDEPAALPLSRLARVDVPAGLRRARREGLITADER